MQTNWAPTTQQPSGPTELATDCAMFSIRLRPRVREIKGEGTGGFFIFGGDEMPMDPRIFHSKSGMAGDRKDDQPPPLLEASFSSLSSSSLSDEEEKSIVSSSSSSDRRVSFLLKQDSTLEEQDMSVIQRRAMFQNRRRSSMRRSILASNSDGNLKVQGNNRIKSCVPLMKGDIPLAKLVLSQDTSSAHDISTPGNRLWMVGIIPESDDDVCRNNDDDDEDVPFDERAYLKKTQDEVGPFDEHVRCNCCRSSAAVTCVSCQQVKVSDLGNGRWAVGTDQHEVTVNLPLGTDIEAELPPNLMIDSELVSDDTLFQFDDKKIQKWTVESILVVLFQLFVLFDVESTSTAAM